jgi:hypothetical protein
MPQSKPHRIVFHLALSLMGLALLNTVAYAQSVKVEGVIKGRSGNTMILQTADSPKVIVLLNVRQCRPEPEIERGPREQRG